MAKIMEYDGVVIGAGHNGMICAGYLAKCGQKIMVVEKNMEVGGGLDSHEDRNHAGFWHNIHSVFHRGLMMLPWYKDLELENFGIHYYRPDPGVVHHFLDKSYLGWFSDVKKTVETIEPAQSGFGMAQNFRNGYVGSYTAGIERLFGPVTVSAAYVATTGIHLSNIAYPNSYAGADLAFAPFAMFNATGRIIGGYGLQTLMSSGAHTTYHGLQTSAGKTSSRYGLGFQSSYTFSKSLDDTSAVLGGMFAGSGAVLQTSPQNPHNPGIEKGVSTFDNTHVFTLSFIQVLPFDRIGAFQSISRKLTSGWQFLNITTLTSPCR